MERNTSQKQIILKYLKGVKCHPTADKVYAEVKKKLPSISKGTVYRILNNYKESGEIQELSLDTNHYDGDISNHSHFICQKCKKVYDLFNNPKEFKFKKNADIGEINNYQIYFHGKCKKCVTKK